MVGGRKVFQNGASLPRVRGVLRGAGQRRFKVLHGACKVAAVEGAIAGKLTLPPGLRLYVLAAEKEQTGTKEERSQAWEHL